MVMQAAEYAFFTLVLVSCACASVVLIGATVAMVIKTFHNIKLGKYQR